MTAMLASNFPIKKFYEKGMEAVCYSASYVLCCFYPHFLSSAHMPFMIGGIINSQSIRNYIIGVVLLMRATQCPLTLH